MNGVHYGEASKKAAACPLILIDFNASKLVKQKPNVLCLFSAKQHVQFVDGRTTCPEFKRERLVNNTVDSLSLVSKERDELFDL